MTSSGGAGGNWPSIESWIACTAAPSGVKWLMSASTRGMICIGQYSPEKNISG